MKLLNSLITSLFLLALPAAADDAKRPNIILVLVAVAVLFLPQILSRARRDGSVKDEFADAGAEV